MFEQSELYRKDIERVAGLPLPWEMLQGKTLLMSGATGMLGSLLIDVLMLRNSAHGGGTKIIAMGRNAMKARLRLGSHIGDGLRFLQHDINLPMPTVGGVDYIIHAASNTHPKAYAGDPVGTISTNVSGTQNMLAYAAEHGAERVMFCSSVEIYGENTGGIHRFAEGDLGYIDCNTLRAGYPESKRLGETLCCAYAEAHGLDIVIPRLCRLYGPTMLPSDSKASSQFINNAVKGEDIVLKSEGKQLYSYCYAADAVAAMLTILLLGKKGEAYNVADEASDVTLKDLAETIAGIAGTKVIFQLPDRAERAGFSKATKALLDAGKLKELGWMPAEDIASGMAKTIGILREAGGTGQAD